MLADGVARGIEGAHRFKEVFPAVARDYIESFELDFDPAPALPLDGLSHDRAREALGAPWPTATLVVVVSEARWLDHLRASLTTFTLRGRTLPAPTDEDIPPPAGPPPEADERAVLWRDDPGPEVWVVERRGTEIHQRWGRRDRRDHEETVEPHASVADAREHLQTIVSDRRQRGYERLADRDEARARVESALGVTFACSAPPIIAEARDPARDVDDTHRLRPLDVITAVGVMGGASFDRLTTLEGLAAALDRRRDESITYVWFERPASRAFASISVELGP